MEAALDYFAHTVKLADGGSGEGGMVKGWYRGSVRFTPQDSSESWGGLVFAIKRKPHRRNDEALFFPSSDV